MSKYHPLDVRHPANRSREKNNYLLAPAKASTYALRKLEAIHTDPSRRAADFSRAEPVVAPATTTPPPATPGAAPSPWGGGTNELPPALRRGLRRWLWWSVLGVIAYGVLSAFGLSDRVGLLIRRIALQWGI